MQGRGAAAARPDAPGPRPRRHPPNLRRGQAQRGGVHHCRCGGMPPYTYAELTSHASSLNTQQNTHLALQAILPTSWPARQRERQTRFSTWRLRPCSSGRRAQSARLGRTHFSARTVSTRSYTTIRGATSGSSEMSCTSCWRQRLRSGCAPRGARAAPLLHARPPRAARWGPHEPVCVPHWPPVPGFGVPEA